MWPLIADRFGLFWSLPEILQYIDQTMDFLFAALFLYTVHTFARRYQTRERLLVPATFASFIAFVGTMAYDLTEPLANRWLLVYAGLGLPYLVLILVLPWINRRIIYSIATIRR